MKKVIVKNDSIVKKILLPMTVLLLVQAVLFCGTIFAAGTVNKLSQNAEDILNERVINRKNYLQGESSSDGLLYLEHSLRSRRLFRIFWKTGTRPFQPCGPMTALQMKYSTAPMMSWYIF